MNSPSAFDTMMRGRLSWLFILMVFFLSILFILSMLYLVFQVQKNGAHYRKRLWALLIIAILSALLLLQPYVIGPSQPYMWINWVNPVGSMQPFKYIALAGMTLSGIGTLFFYLGTHKRGFHWGQMGHGGRVAQASLLVLAIFGSLQMFLMGYIRENSRLPYLIYFEQRLDQPERFPQLPPIPNSAGPSSYRPPGMPAINIR